MYRAKLKYHGETGTFCGKFFSHGRIYNVELVSITQNLMWLRIGSALIPYTKEGFKKIWGSE